MSWNKINNWYDDLVGQKGHYYHKEVIFPNLLKLINIKDKKISLVDLACGQGALARNLDKEVQYLGVDNSKGLIEKAAKYNKNLNHKFILKDLSKKMEKSEKTFDIATIILALQDIDNPKNVLINANNFLKKDGKLFIVINHPCFRIPRQSYWDINENNKLQSRAISTYMSEMTIPIYNRPFKSRQSVSTNYYHLPLSSYFSFLKEAGFLVENIHEWVSNKISEGKNKKMEDRARKEIPLFLCIEAKKIN